jgi:hypothetical protein
MRVVNFAEIEPEFIERAHRMVWCDLATVGPDGRPRTRVVHPVWREGVGYVTSLRTGPKADDIERNPYVSLAYIGDPLKPAYAECRADWIDDPAERRQLWDWIATIPEPLGYDTARMGGDDDYPGNTIMRLRPWRIRVSEVENQTAQRVWQEE